MFQRFATGLMTGQAQADRTRTRTAQDEAARMLKEGNTTGASQALMSAGLYGDAATMTNVSGVNRRTDARVTAGRNFMTDPRAAAGTLFDAGEFDDGRTMYGEAINREAGAALAADDPKRASAIAAAGGKVEMATQLIDWADRLDARGREEALGRQKTMAPILFNIARLPYEQRRQAIEAQNQALGGAGFTAEQIAGFDPTDENIRALVDSRRHPTDGRR